ncbi:MULTISPECIES: cytoplasmic protein [unclassified Microcoleus]|uniref:cytoplasmic protein n=1 Tax=unclassified Microcoleus TaxID=2642155 RepID=UPI002FCFE917
MAEYGGCCACRHLFHGVYVDEIPTCRAFPEGIPLIFVVGGIQHIKPLPDQDNTIVYEPAEKPFWLTE